MCVTRGDEIRTSNEGLTVFSHCNFGDCRVAQILLITACVFSKYTPRIFFAIIIRLFPW